MQSIKLDPSIVNVWIDLSTLYEPQEREFDSFLTYKQAE